MIKIDIKHNTNVSLYDYICIYLSIFLSCTENFITFLLQQTIKKILVSPNEPICHLKFKNT